MKRFLRKSIAFTMVFFMAVGLFWGNMSEVSAHEIYYENGVGIQLKWNNITSDGNVYL